MKDSFKTYPQDGSWMSAYRWKERMVKQLREKLESLCYHNEDAKKVIENLLGGKTK